MRDENAARSAYFAEKLKKPKHLKDLKRQDPPIWQLTEALREAYFKALKEHEDQILKFDEPKKTK